MTIADVYIAGTHLALATDEEVDAAEQALRTRLPAGYREYVTTLGAGLLNDTIRLVMPTDIVQATQEFHETDAIFAEDDMDLDDLFESGLDLLPPDRLRAAILFGWAYDSNRLVFHPDTPDALFLVDDTEIFALGQSIDEAITWILEGDVYGSTWQHLDANGEVTAGPTWYFEPEGGERERLTFHLRRDVPFAEVRSYLLDLKRRHPETTLLIRQLFADEDDPAMEHEALHVGLSECGALVWCGDGQEEPDGNTLQITYERGRTTARLDDLIVFCHRRARHVI